MLFVQVSVHIGSFNISQPLVDWTVFQTDDLPLHYYKLEDLDPLSYYELEIRAENNMGWSEPNKQFVFVTAEGMRSPQIGEFLRSFWVFVTFSSFWFCCVLGKIGAWLVTVGCGMVVVRPVFSHTARLSNACTFVTRR